MKNTKTIYNVSPVKYKPTEQQDLVTIDTKEKYEINRGNLKPYENSNREKRN